MKSYGWVGILLLAISEYCLFRKIEPFYSWFYCFAWWSYILIADSLLLRIRGRSLFSQRRAELLHMLPISVMIWLLFEGYNLVVRNWAYSGVPAELWERWTGYTLAFATVLPGIFITGDLVQALFLREGNHSASQCEIAEGGLSTSGVSLFLAIGVVFSAAPLVWPRFMFPAVWIGPIFLLDPLLERAGFKSLRMQVATRQWQRIWSLLLGGLVCGALWELWNFWAGSKWIYTIPFFGNLKVFEMPLLGFLGFPPFALECWILYHLLRALVGRLRFLPGHAVLYMATVVLCVLMYRQIDAHTVVRFAENFSRSLGLWSRG